MTKTIAQFFLLPAVVLLVGMAFLMPVSTQAQNVSSMSLEDLIQLVNRLQAQTLAQSGTIESATFTTSRPTIRGTANNVSTVSFRLTTNTGDAYNSGSIRVGSNGRWSHQVNADLRNGTYTAILSGTNVTLSTGQIVVQTQSSNTSSYSVEQLIALIAQLQAEIAKRQTPTVSPNVSAKPTLRSYTTRTQYEIGETVQVQYTVQGASSGSQVEIETVLIERFGNSGYLTGGSWQSVEGSPRGNSTGVYNMSTGGGYLNTPGVYEVRAKLIACEPAGCNYHLNPSRTVYAVATPFRITIGSRAEQASASCLFTSDNGGQSDLSFGDRSVSANSCRELCTISRNEKFGLNTGGSCSFTATNGSQSIMSIAPSSAVAPSISSFTATPTSVTSGQSVTFTWASTGTSRCDLRIARGNDLTQVVADNLSTSGSRTINSVTSSATYVLSCYSSTNSSTGATRRIDVNVTPVAVNPGAIVAGVYEGTLPGGAKRGFQQHPEGTVTINVTGESSGNRHLILTSYEPVHWIINNPNNIAIDKVILIGYYDQRASGLPAGTTVEHVSYQSNQTYLGTVQAGSASAALSSWLNHRYGDNWFIGQRSYTGSVLNQYIGQKG